MTKKQKCKKLALEHITAERADWIELFVSKVGLTRAAAATYATTIKKELDATAGQRAMQEARDNETDVEIATRLAERFDVINRLADASCNGAIRSLIVSGPAGLGKSFTIEHAIKQYDPREEKSIIAKGFVRPTGLYLLLHEYRHKGNVIVLDDADSIFADQDALNILKAACDTTKKRSLSWRAETKMVDVDGEPVDRTFEYNGTIIFITNKDFDAEIQKGGKGAEHFEALVSRSHYVECDMHTVRDYIVRIKQVVGLGMLRDQKGLNTHAEKLIVRFIEDNADKLRELTLRMALKLADVYKLDPSRFESLAKVSCFKARYAH